MPIVMELLNALHNILLDTQKNNPLLDAKPMMQPKEIRQTKQLIVEIENKMNFMRSQ